MKWRYILVLAGLIAISAQAQSDLTMTLNKEGKAIFIPKRISFNLNIPKFTYKSYTPAPFAELDARLRDFIPQLAPVFYDRPMDMQVLSTAYRPFFNIYTPMLQQVSPMALDFNETLLAPVDQNLTLFVNGQQNTWPGAGGNTLLTGGLAWSEGGWSLSGSAFGGRFFTPFNPSPGLMVGANLNLKYEITDWMAARLWGQYSYYKDNNYNSFLLLNPNYPHTSVGGAMEFKFNENFGIGVGVNYEYNPFERKMERQMLVYPIFHVK